MLVAIFLDCMCSASMFYGNNCLHYPGYIFGLEDIDER